MTIKPSRTSTRNAASEQKLPAAMMTIPDFCWQPAMVVRSGNPSANPLPEPTLEHPNSTESPPSLDSSTVAARQETDDCSPEVVRRERTRLVTIDLRRLKDGLRRHWFPVGGMAVALLWIASVLISGGETPPDPLAPEGPRQARREAMPKLAPLAEGQLRVSGSKASETAAMNVETPSDSAPELDEQPELFESVPTLSNLPREERPDSELPAIPALNPPSGTPQAVDATPDSGTAVESGHPASSRVDASRPRTVESVVPGKPVPVADEPPRARETEYEWGTPNRPAGPASPLDVARETADSSRPSSTTVSDSRAVSPGRPAYRQTDPASYKDPLYVIPPLARQRQASGYR